MTRYGGSDRRCRTTGSFGVRHRWGEFLNGLNAVLRGAMVALFCSIAGCGYSADRPPRASTQDSATKYRAMVEHYLTDLDPARALVLRHSLPAATKVIEETGQLSTDQTNIKAFVDAVTASGGLAIKTDTDGFQLLKPTADLTATWKVPLGNCVHHTWLAVTGDLKRAALQESCQGNDILLLNAADGAPQRIQVPASLTVARGFDDNGNLLLVLSQSTQSSLSTYRWDASSKTLLEISTRRQVGYSYFNCRNLSKDVEGLFYVAMKNDGHGGQLIARWRGKDYAANLAGTPFGDCVVASQGGSPLVVLRTEEQVSDGKHYTLKTVGVGPVGFVQGLSDELRDPDINIVGVSEVQGEVYIEKRGFSASTVVREIQALRVADRRRRVVVGKLPITGGVIGVVSPGAAAASWAIAGEGILAVVSQGATCTHRVNAEWMDQRADGVAIIDVHGGEMSIFPNQCSVQSSSE